MLNITSKASVYVAIIIRWWKLAFSSLKIETVKSKGDESNENSHYYTNSPSTVLELLREDERESVNPHIDLITKAIVLKLI